MAKKFILTPARRLNTALAMAGVATNEATCDLILQVQSALEKMGGDFSMRDAVKIQCAIEAKYKPKEETVTPAPKPETHKKK